MNSTTALTLDTPLRDLATDEPSKSGIYDNLDAIGNDLIDATIVGEDWGDALDRVLRASPAATIADLRDALLDAA